MPAREDLEAELLATWNPQTLSIYADHLQSLGDPRGDLIALDLADPEGSAGRGELLREWLGTSLPLWWDADEGSFFAGDARARTFVSFDRGLCELAFLGDGRADDATMVERFFASPAAPYLRRARVCGSGQSIAAILRMLSATRRPWLRHLMIRRTEVLEGDTRELPVAAPGLHDALVAATPGLELFELNGSRILEQFSHPTVTELRITGHDAMRFTEGGPMPRVRVIDFAFERGLTEGQLGDRFMRRRFFTPARCPQVRDIRFWRDEPGYLHLFDDLDELPFAPQLEHLYLPSLRSARDVANVQAALEEMPRLRTVVIARAYADHIGWGTELRHPTARVELPDHNAPWPAPDPAEYVAFDELQLPLDLLVDACEDAYDDLPAESRQAWDHLWQAVRDGRETGVWLGLRTLARAVIRLGRTDLDDDALQVLQQRLRRLDDAALEDTIRVRSYRDA